MRGDFDHDQPTHYHEFEWPPRPPGRCRCRCSRIAKVGEDAELLELFEEWKIALGACSGPNLDGAHNHLRAIEERVASLPAEGVAGVGIKLSIWHFVCNHWDTAADLAVSALDDVERFTGRSFSSEAEAF